MKFDFFKNHDTFGLRGLDGLKRELGLLLAKKTMGVVFETIMRGTIPLKPSIDD